MLPQHHQRDRGDTRKTTCELRPEGPWPVRAVPALHRQKPGALVSDFTVQVRRTRRGLLPHTTHWAQVAEAQASLTGLRLCMLHFAFNSQPLNTGKD